MTNLPAYLQKSQGRNLNEVATTGLGSVLPPHISIQGNTFTLIDASGNEQPEGPALDACVADISDVVCKRFYAEKWTPDSKDPPLCWSANGVAPSREASQPQSALCAECPKNERGSAISAISGASIKACRDEKWLALILPKYPSMRFQLVLTPGSFNNWRAYLEKCRGSNTDIKDVLTRLTFEPKTTGVLQFTPVNYIDEITYQAREAGYGEKAFDVLVGRNDIPIQRALPSPQGGVLQGNGANLAAPAPTAAVLTGAGVSSGQQTGFAAGAAPSGNGPFGAGGVATPTPNATGATTASPSEQPHGRRRRRTAAEIAAANATAGGGQNPATPPVTGSTLNAPFRPQIAPAQPQTSFGSGAPAANNFGIQPGVAPNPEIENALNSLFGSQEHQSQG